jgi:hypothetical protein
MNAFKLQGIEYICGKNRNIYFKMNKNNAALGKTRYIKYKRVFIKLSTFIKEHYNKNTKKHINYEKKPNVAVINNINDIKDKKIRALFKRTFKKNAKIYIYSSKKLKRGGAITNDFDRDVWKNNDMNTYRIIEEQVYDNKLARISREIPSPSRQPYPYNVKVVYNDKVDDIILRIFELARVESVFRLINNIQYSIVVDSKTYVIRPYIEFAKPYKKFLLFFYINNDEFNSGSTKRWIRLPLHISLFMNDKIEKILEHNVEKIKRLNTGHIHITSEERIGNFNIGTTLGKTKRSATNPAISSNPANHIYLIASNLKDVALIMEKHGKEIFEDWYYTEDTEVQTKYLNFTLYKPTNNKWEFAKSNNVSKSQISIQLNVEQKRSIYHCFNKLHYVIGNIFYIMDIGGMNKEGVIDDYYIKTATPIISTSIISPSAGSEFLYYTPSRSQTTNIRYTKDKDNYTERKSLVVIDDLNKGKPYIEPVRSRVPVRGNIVERYRDRSRDPSRGRRNGGTHTKRKRDDIYGNPSRSLGEDERSSSENAKIEERLDAKARMQKPLSKAPQADTIAYEEITRAKQHALDNLIMVDKNYKNEQERIATLERENMQRMTKEERAAAKSIDIKTE